MAQTQVNIRLDTDLLTNSKEVLDNLGLSVQEAFKIFLKKVVSFQGIPFLLKVENQDYSLKPEVEKSIIEEMEHINENPSFKTVEGTLDYLHNL